MWLIENTPNQNHKAKIFSLREPSNTKMLFINITIRLLHTNTEPKIPATTIGLGTHCYTPATSNVYLASPVDQFLQQRFKPAVTGHQIIVDNNTYVTPLLKKWLRPFQNSPPPTQPEPQG